MTHDAELERLTIEAAERFRGHEAHRGGPGRTGDGVANALQRRGMAMLVAQRRLA